MPEGPEVHRFADQLQLALANQSIVQLTARTQVAKRWLVERPSELLGRTIRQISARGKNLIGWVEGDYYFYSHLMMWGRWMTFEGDPSDTIDRRERARIVMPAGGAILLSAPVFQLGQGDPYTQVEVLRSLGPDILPALNAAFDQEQFRARLLTPAHYDRTIGAALLDQTIVAGIGNYLRAEILFLCRIDPWRRVQELTELELNQLCQMIPQIAHRAYETGGVTASDADRSRMQQDSTLVYRLGSEFGNRHYVFRRTNLPCLRCGTPIRQQKQMIHAQDDEEKTRIIYFCPTCQNTSIPLPARRKKSRSNPIASA